MKKTELMKGMCLGFAAGAAVGMVISPIRRRPKNLAWRMTRALSALADSASELIR